jgi:hypothetical protein
MGSRTVSSTVIVSPAEAWGYVRARYEVPGVRVEACVPKTTEERQLFVAEHIGSLLVDHRPGPGEKAQFVYDADLALRGAFAEPDGAVLVRLTTPAHDTAGRRLDTLVQLAAHYAANLYN